MDSKAEFRLTYTERQFAIKFAENLKYHNKEEKATTSKNLVDSYNASHKLKLTRGKVRDIISYCRVTGLITNLIAGNSGYWFEDDLQARRKYIKKIDSRIREMKKIKNSIDISSPIVNQISLFV